MGSGILWSVNGKSITRDASRDKAGDIDFDLNTGVNTVPMDIVNNVTGENYSIQISLAYEGEFEFICSDIVAEDGTASLALTHASDYGIVINGDEEESGTVMEAASSTVMEPAQLGTQDRNGDGAAESSQTRQEWKTGWFIVAGVMVILVGIGVFFVVRRKKRG